jgi:starch synthase (maltosyl-transferring)
MYNQKYPQSKERYYHSEKFEIANHKWHIRNRVTKLITNLNHLRKEQPALQNIFNLHFTKSDNEHFLSFVKATPDRSNIIWCVVNLDTHHSHSGYVEIPKEFLGIKGGWVNLRMEDLLTGEIYHWFNDWNYVELKLEKLPLHVFRVTF